MTTRKRQFSFVDLPTTDTDFITDRSVDRSVDRLCEEINCSFKRIRIDCNIEEKIKKCESFLKGGNENNIVEDFKNNQFNVLINISKKIYDVLSLGFSECMNYESNDISKKYYNSVYIFNLEDYKFKIIENIFYQVIRNYISKISNEIFLLYPFRIWADLHTEYIEGNNVIESFMNVAKYNFLLEKRKERFLKIT